MASICARPSPVFPIIGPRTLEQLSNSLPAGDLNLDADTARWLETGAPEQLAGSRA